MQKNSLLYPKTRETRHRQGNQKAESKGSHDHSSHNFSPNSIYYEFIYGEFEVAAKGRPRIPELPNPTSPYAVPYAPYGTQNAYF